jgi:hypothetical protein
MSSKTRLSQQNKTKQEQQQQEQQTVLLHWLLGCCVFPVLFKCSSVIFCSKFENLHKIQSESSFKWYPQRQAGVQVMWTEEHFVRPGRTDLALDEHAFSRPWERLLFGRQVMKWTLLICLLNALPAFWTQPGHLLGNVSQKQWPKHSTSTVYVYHMYFKGILRW